MKRCSKCNNRKLEHCRGADKACECKCTVYQDTTTNRLEEDRLSDTENDDFIEEINKQFNELRN